jgi:hypothetical protein
MRFNTYQAIIDLFLFMLHRKGTLLLNSVSRLRMVALTGHVPNWLKWKNAGGIVFACWLVGESLFKEVEYFSLRRKTKCRMNRRLDGV